MGREAQRGARAAPPAGELYIEPFFFPTQAASLHLSQRLSQKPRLEQKQCQLSFSSKGIRLIPGHQAVEVSLEEDMAEAELPSALRGHNISARCLQSKVYPGRWLDAPFAEAQGLCAACVLAYSSPSSGDNGGEALLLVSGYSWLRIVEGIQTHREGPHLYFFN